MKFTIDEPTKPGVYSWVIPGEEQGAELITSSILKNKSYKQGIGIKWCRFVPEDEVLQLKEQTE